MYVSSKATMVVDFQALFGKFDKSKFSSSKYTNLRTNSKFDSILYRKIN